MRILTWSCAVLLVMAIIGTQSRGGTLGIVAVLGYRWLRSSHKLLGLAGIAVIGATMLLFAPPAYFDRMGTITSHTDGSAQGRIQAWSGGIGMAVNNPVFGVGAGQFGPRWGKTAHSSYVLLFAELGFPGLVVIIMLVFGNLHANMKVRTIVPGTGPTVAGRVRERARQDAVRDQRRHDRLCRGGSVPVGTLLSAPVRVDRHHAFDPSATILRASTGERSDAAESSDCQWPSTCRARPQWCLPAAAERRARRSPGLRPAPDFMRP